MLSRLPLTVARTMGLTRPPESGIYQLLFHLSSSIRTRIGALGVFDFSSGYYVYTGSARRALPGRVQRHLQPQKICRWHLDYLTTREAFVPVGIRCSSHGVGKECEMNRRLLKLRGASVPVRGFGSSDCRAHCPAHLVYFDSIPPFKWTGCPR